MLSSLTVMELLWCSASLRLPADTPAHHMKMWVRTVVDLLGLGPHRRVEVVMRRRVVRDEVECVALPTSVTTAAAACRLILAHSNKWWPRRYSSTLG